MATAEYGISPSPFHNKTIGNTKLVPNIDHLGFVLSLISKLGQSLFVRK